jgi:hypothetical protein
MTQRPRQRISAIFRFTIAWNLAEATPEAAMAVRCRM